MGWFDGNPAHLWEHPPVEAATRYVDFMGGADAVLEKARAAFEAGDLRWVVEVVNHVVFAEPDNAAARELQAQALEQLGYGAENAVWRNFFLTGAKELREGVAGTAVSTAPADIVASLSCEQLFDSMAIRLDGPKRLRDRADAQLGLPGPRRELLADARERGADPPRRLRRGRRRHDHARPHAADRILTGGADLQNEMESGAIQIEGDGAKLGELLSFFDAPDPSFAIVTP